MIKLIIILIAICSSQLLAQQSSYISGEASVNLVVPLSIKASGGDLDFGDIFVSNSTFTEKILPKDGKEFTIVGQPKRLVTVRFNSVELTNYQWASINKAKLGKLNFIPIVNTKNSKEVLDGNNIELSKKGLVGEVVLLVGGSITIPPNQVVGNYEGLFILSVTY